MSELPKAQAPVDYDGLMRANLVHVFGERDARKRLDTIRRLYAPDAVLNEPDRSVKGHDEINDAVTDLLGTLPADFEFRALADAMGHHGIGVLTWVAGPGDGSTAASGMDVAQFQDGVIHSLTVFLNPTHGA